MCTSCYDEQPLKISVQSKQVAFDMKFCNYHILNFVKNDFKVKN